MFLNVFTLDNALIAGALFIGPALMFGFILLMGRLSRWHLLRRKPEIWKAAFEQHGLDIGFYTARQRRTDEVFPWEHITAAVRKNFLFQDFRMSLEGQIRVDCRQDCFACGILPTFSNLRRENPGEGWKCPDVKSPAKKTNVELPVVGG